MNDRAQIFHPLQAEALEIRQTPYGSVGRLFSGEGIEAVCVSKEDEQVEPGWFSQKTVDLLVVIQGQLKVEFERADRADEMMGVGDVLVLPAGERCRAFRWPRDRKEASVFLAVYPKKDEG
jgi:hypothetical protein